MGFREDMWEEISTVAARQKVGHALRTRLKPKPEKKKPKAKTKKPEKKKPKAKTKKPVKKPKVKKRAKVKKAKATKLKSEATPEERMAPAPPPRLRGARRGCERPRRD